MTRDSSWRSLSQRHGRQLGALDAVLRTTDLFTVVTCSHDVDDIALQISRNFFQYFGADSQIITEQAESSIKSGNVIVVAVGKELPPPKLDGFPLLIKADSLSLSIANTGTTRNYGHQEGLGAVFLRPLEDQRLELVVWGTDKAGLRQAARLVPMLTGVGQADFVIISSTAPWKGHAGTLATGFFDHSWNVSRGSFVT